VYLIKGGETGPADLTAAGPIIISKSQEQFKNYND